MSRSLSAILLLFAAWAHPSATAPEPKGENGTVVDASQIQAVLDRLVDAWNADDLEGHVAPYAADATYTTADGLVRGRSAIVDLLSGFRQDGGLIGTLRFEDVDIRVLGRSAALATGRFVLAVGSGQDIDGRFSLVLERRRGGWQVLHDHSS